MNYSSLHARTGLAHANSQRYVFTTIFYCYLIVFLSCREKTLFHMNSPENRHRREFKKWISCPYSGRWRQAPHWTGPSKRCSLTYTHLFGINFFFFFYHLHIGHVLSFSIFLSSPLSSVPLSLLPFLPSFSPGCVWWGPGVVRNKRQQNYLPADFHRNAEGENAKFKSCETSAGTCPAPVFKQLDFVCMYACAQSIWDSFNVLGSPTPNQIGVQSSRKVHRGLSLMHCNRLLSFC